MKSVIFYLYHYSPARGLFEGKLKTVERKTMEELQNH